MKMVLDEHVAVRSSPTCVPNVAIVLDAYVFLQSLLNNILDVFQSMLGPQIVDFGKTEPRIFENALLYFCPVFQPLFELLVVERTHWIR